MNRDLVYGGMVHRGMCCAAFFDLWGRMMNKVCLALKVDVFAYKEEV